MATKNQSHSLLSSLQPGKTAVPFTEQQAGSSKPLFRMLTSEMLTSFRGALRLSQGAPLPCRGTVRAPAQSASLLPQCPLPSTGGEPQDSHLIAFALLKEFLSSSFFYLPNPNTRSRRLCNISLEDNSGGFNSQAQPGPTPQLEPHHDSLFCPRARAVRAPQSVASIQSRPAAPERQVKTPPKTSTISLSRAFTVTEHRT